MGGLRAYYSETHRSSVKPAMRGYYVTSFSENAITNLHKVKDIPLDLLDYWDGFKWSIQKGGEVYVCQCMFWLGAYKGVL